ncbi:mechanosensitive ion channel domain-containing protein [Paraglaciecola sp. 2405UD69-4]|uniref:mechanosensitive ion channel domain-containing protein n=1 Tax=Paraglaciecola sp. 2405UD69-4 TaxID=3391836 RepID=UPI0039C94507
MDLSDNLLMDWLPALVTLCFFGFVTWLSQKLMLIRQQHKGNENTFSRQVVTLLLLLVGLISVVISLPLKENLEIQILSLIGLVLSGLLAFSSTTIFGNLVAGTLLRFTQPFGTGDFIRINGTFGRVTELGLFDCEVQTESRELVSIPNSILITNAVTVVRRSGTIISVELSLGYDLHHSRIEELLLKAAEQSGLEDGFVHVTKLGDFSVSYKISGLLVEVKNLLTARSNLHKYVLDCLHDNDIEIMSPNFISQHAGPDAKRMIAHSPAFKKVKDESIAEDLIFDKAEQAQQIENDRLDMLQRIEQLKESLKHAEKDKQQLIDAEIEQLKIKVSELKEVAEDPDNK